MTTTLDRVNAAYAASGAIPSADVTSALAVFDGIAAWSLPTGRGEARTGIVTLPSWPSSTTADWLDDAADAYSPTGTPNRKSGIPAVAAAKKRAAADLRTAYTTNLVNVLEGNGSTGLVPRLSSAVTV